MSEDPVLKALADAARVDDPLADPRWERLAERTLSDDDEAALAELAGRSERHREAFEAFRPLPADARGRIAEKLLEGMKARPRRDPASAPAVVALPARRRWAWVLAAAAALGAASWLTVVPRGEEGALPAYAMTVSGGEPGVRSLAPATQPLRLGAGSRLEIHLRPATTARGGIAVRAFLVRDGAARAWDVPTTVADSGAARIQGSREALFAGVPAGPWEIVIAVGRAAALPSADDVVAAGAHPGSPGYRLLRHEIVLLDGPGP